MMTNEGAVARFRGLELSFTLVPGAHAPGFTLPLAPQALCVLYAEDFAFSRKLQKNFKTKTRALAISTHREMARKIAAWSGAPIARREF
jgi:hypothetical protein